MQKIKIDNNAFVYPMPMVLAGTMVSGKANFMAVGWVSRVNFKPPLIAIALGPHHTNKGIDENRAFSVNIPGLALMEKTDYCGLVSGAKTDKSQVFDLFFGQRLDQEHSGQRSGRSRRWAGGPWRRGACAAGPCRGRWR